MNRCTWTETIIFEKFITETITLEKFIHKPYYDEIKNEQRQRQCENMIDEQFDEYGRAYCKEHRIKVDEINKSRHKNCINKEKLINSIKEQIQDELEQGNDGRIYIDALDLIKELENGDFDND